MRSRRRRGCDVREAGADSAADQRVRTPADPAEQAGRRRRGGAVGDVAAGDSAPVRRIGDPLLVRPRSPLMPMAFAQQVGLAAVSAALSWGSFRFARPTAACGDTPDSIEVSAPGRAEARSTVRPSTTLVMSRSVRRRSRSRAGAWAGAGASGTAPGSLTPRGAEPAEPSIAAAKSTARAAGCRRDTVDLLVVRGQMRRGHASVVRSDNQDGSCRHVLNGERRYE